MSIGGLRVTCLCRISNLGHRFSSNRSLTLARRRWNVPSS